MSNRIVCIDAFKGLFLVAMTFYHLIALPFISMDFLLAWVKTYVFGPYSCFSSKEGFFFLAGVVSGIVYGKSTLAGNSHEIWPKIKKRIAQMYGLHLLLLLGVSFFVWASHHYQSQWQHICTIDLFVKNYSYFFEHPWIGFCLGSLFLFSLPFFDILPIYMAFLLITPWVISLLHKRKWGILWVSLLSVSCWFLPHYLPFSWLEKNLCSFFPCKLGAFNFFAVQIFFVTGLIIGFFFKKGTFKRSTLIVPVSLFFLLSFLVFSLTKKDMAQGLGVVKMAIFTLQAFCALMIARFFTFKPLALLGRQAFSVFGYHIALVYALIFFLPEISNLSLPGKIAALLCALSTLWAPVLFSTFINSYRKKSAVAIPKMDS